MAYVRLGLIVVLALFMAFIGSQKFTGDNAVFSYIAWQSGLSIFEPWVRLATGLAELAASALLVAGLFLNRLKGTGAVLSLAVIAGAIVFHLSPWLGVVAPVAFSESAMPPYTDQSDYQMDIMLFILAIVFFTISLFLTWLDRDNLLMAVGRSSQG